MGRFCIAAKGTLVRALFSIHAGLSIWLVSAENEKLWLFWLLFLLLIFIEGVFTIRVKKHGTWKWFSPTVVLYLMCSVPCLWKLEWDTFEIRRNLSNNATNETTITCAQSGFEQIGLPPILGFEVPLIKEIQLILPQWTLILHQTLLFQLILGRWLLPKGELSRDQLSQLLLVQIGMAADILEFITEGLKAEMIYVGNDLHLILMLSVWTWSLPQFTLSLTLTKSRKPRVAGTVDLLEVDSKEKFRMKDRRRGNQSSCCHLFCGTEIWAILVTMTMQDLPFLGTRLYLIFNPQIPLSIPFFFFTFKNALLAMLQLYRLSVILQQYRNQRMARAKVTPEHNPVPMMVLEDGMPNHMGYSPHVPESQREASAAPAAWFPSRFFHGFGPKLRQRKHVSIQTEQSLQIVASISSRWAVDVNNGYYQYTAGDDKYRNSGITNSHEVFSSDSHGAVYRRYGSSSFSESPYAPGCQVNIAAEEDDKKDVFAVCAPPKYEVSGLFDTKADRAECNGSPGHEGRVRSVDAVDSTEGENTIDDIYEIMSNLDGCRDAGSQSISRGEKNPNGPRVHASGKRGESRIGGGGDGDGDVNG